MTFGDYIQEKRKLKRLTLSDLARVTGISYGGIEKIEGSRVTNPRFETLCRLSMALDISMEEMKDVFLDCADYAKRRS
jgi:transcriptional regulator with XRE-family HTH domain